MGYKQIKDSLPEPIEVACHNSSTSCTISGPDEDMVKYVSELKRQNIFAKAVNVSNIAYHSRYIAPAGPKLLSLLKEVKIIFLPCISSIFFSKFYSNGTFQFS